jgi:hypothetical protein
MFTKMNAMEHYTHFQGNDRTPFCLSAIEVKVNLGVGCDGLLKLENK